MCNKGEYIHGICYTKQKKIDVVHLIGSLFRSKTEKGGGLLNILNLKFKIVLISNIQKHSSYY